MSQWTKVNCEHIPLITTFFSVPVTGFCKRTRGTSVQYACLWRQILLRRQFIVIETLSSKILLCMYRCIHLCVHMERSEVDIGSWSLWISCFERDYFPKPEAHQLTRPARKLTSCFCLPVLGLQCSTYYVGTGSLNSATYACAASTVTTEPIP